MKDAIAPSTSRQRVAVIGCGFFGTFQVGAWASLEGAKLVGVCDRDPARARAASQLAGDVPFYLDPEEMLRETSPDVVDIATMPRAHLPLAQLCAEFRTSAIIQKPLAMNLGDAIAIANLAKAAGVTMAVHENNRFRRPVREAKRLIDAGTIGEPRYCSISRRTAFASFARDPVLREGERIVLADMGAHVFDVARYLMGSMTNLSCRTLTLTEGLKGDEMASALVGFESGAIGVVSCSSASILPDARSLDIHITIEGTIGSVILGENSTIALRSGKDVRSWTVNVPKPSWGSEHWKGVQDAVASVCQNWLDAKAGRASLENAVDDNLAVIAAIEAGYASAARGGDVVRLDEMFAIARGSAQGALEPDSLHH